MEAAHKRILRPLSLALRHELEGWRDENGGWHPGDLERRLAELGIHREKSKPLDEMPHLSGDDRRARVVVDGYLQLRSDAGIERDDAVAEFVRESAYTWANRLFALRCMEARSIIEEVILQKAAYAGHSLVHQRFLRKNPDAAAGADDGLFAVLFAEFAARAAELPALFDPQAAAVALRPSVAALKRCVALLSGTESVRGQEPATDEVFSAPDAFGWAYQYWNTEEKDRVFDTVRTKKGTKIEGADIIPATQLYTEPYMVKFLVQNSLGALWMSLHPDSRLCAGWEYYARDADRAPVETPAGGRSVRDFTFLDPALGSGHFHLEAFDLFFAMYREENPALTSREIAASILNGNLFGIDLDERAVQIAEAALWMKAKDAAPELEASDLDTFHDHLVATNIRLPRGRDHLEAFLRQHSEDAPLRPALELVFRGLEHADELGALLQIEEPVDRELRRLKAETDTSCTTPPMQPDMFRTTAVQSALPIGVESYEAWKAGALDRLKAHFEQEAEAADSLRAFFGASARKGLALFDLFARRYDIVAANPPYMGSKNMGAMLKSFVERGYATGKRDLYAAFILRCRELTAPGGRVAMVTQQSWMFLRSFADLRAVESAKLQRSSTFRGLLRDAAFESLAHLGPGAFGEISGEVVNIALFVLVKREPEIEHRFTALRAVGPRSPEEKAALLREAIARHRGEAGKSHPIISRPLQRRFLDIPKAPLSYWLSEVFLELLHKLPPLGEFSYVRQGICTTDNPRFVRSVWEAGSQDMARRWFLFAKGGGSKRWSGFDKSVVDWGDDGIRVKAHQEDTPGAIHWSGRMPERSYFFKPGWTFSRVGRGSLAAREMPRLSLFCDTSPAAIAFDVADRLRVGFWLNTRIYSYLLRSLTQSLDCREGYVQRLPLPSVPADELMTEPVNVCIGLRRFLNSLELDEWLFDPASVSITDRLKFLSVEAAYLFVEAYRERIATDALELGDEDIAAMTGDVGSPAGWFPLLQCHDAAPPLPAGLPEFPAEVLASVVSHEHRSLSAPELVELKQRLREHFASGPGGSVEGEEVEDGGDEESDEEETLIVGAHLPIPSETFLEELSQKVELHPISVFWLLKEGIEQEGWRCLPEEKRLIEDRFTVLVLRMLGHRWPQQIEAGESLPDWADRDGVIPLSSGSSEPTLAARVLERLGGELSSSHLAAIRAAFEENMGTPLEAWLASGFFARHIRQFKSRPIAWQLRSQPAAQSGRRRSSPARGPVFVCLVYYHRLDADLLPKLRSHYLTVLRTAHETELRTLEALAQPTPDQGARKAELEVLVDELNRFDAKLQDVVETGFCPAPFQPRLRQLAVDDAMLAMKARWLARLSETLQAAPLAEWQTAATALGHHAEFPRWIATAIARLPHHCSKAGADSPDAAKLPEDPTPTTLAAVICAETDQMTAAALGLACAEWMHDWDTHVIDPLRARISAASSALETLVAELNTMVRSNTARVEEIAREQKRLRAEVKSLKAEIKTKTEKASHFAESIRKWTSPELPTWESWLASSPLYDEVSSLDGHRAAPVTIRDFVQQESFYAPDLNDGVRVNIAPLQRAGLLAADVIASKDVDKAIADRAEWRADERRWVREGKLPQCGWWVVTPEVTPIAVPTFERPILAPVNYAVAVLIALLKESGGSCATMRLAGAYGLLAEAELMVGNAPADLAKTVKLWRQRSRKQKVEIGLFRAALDDLRSRDVLVPEERNGRTFERLDERMLATQIEDWIRLDAALALRTIDSLDAARQEPILEEYPAEERQRWVA